MGYGFICSKQGCDFVEMPKVVFPENNILGRYIRGRRKAMNLGLRDFACELGWRGVKVSGIETGKVIPTSDEMKILDEFFKQKGKS